MTKPVKIPYESPTAKDSAAVSAKMICASGDPNYRQDPSMNLANGGAEDDF